MSTATPSEVASSKGESVEKASASSSLKDTQQTAQPTMMHFPQTAFYPWFGMQHPGMMGATAQAPMSPLSPVVMLPPMMPQSNGAAPSPRVLKLYPVPVGDNSWQFVLQDATTEPTPPTSASNGYLKNMDSSTPVPPKKRRHYEDDGSISSTSSSDGQVEFINSSNESTGDSSSRSKRPYQHQPNLSEEQLRNMSPEQVKRERNRLAADRCRKKKLAKIDTLSRQVTQMEKKRSQTLYQLESLRHAAIAARSTIESHQKAGCHIKDDCGALARLVHEAESLDKFVKSQL